MVPLIFPVFADTHNIWVRSNIDLEMSAFLFSLGCVVEAF